MEYKIFGCKVNKYYTDKWLKSKELNGKQGIFIASCVVTDKAKKKWVKFVIESVKNLKENEKIYISGCGAFKDGKAQTDFFDLYQELSEFKDKIEILGEDPEESIENDNKSIKIKNIPKNLYTKKFVLIQGGCDSFCTFCLTVKKRGRHFYRQKEEIVKEINDFELTGGKEVVLTGVNLAAWGLKTTNDIGKSRLGELLEYILLNTQIPRIRISSLGPEFVDKECLEIFKQKRIYPHFHFSVQSGSSSVLKAMSRHYDSKYMRDILEKTKKVKREDGVDISLGADIIVGFPGETDEGFEETFNLVKECNINKLHGFPFSAHDMGESVSAGSFQNQIDDATKKERLSRLLDLGDSLRKDFIESQIGKPLEVLIESVKDGKRKGWTQNYLEANSDNFKISQGVVKRNELIKGCLIKI